MVINGRTGEPEEQATAGVVCRAVTAQRADERGWSRMSPSFGRPDPAFVTQLIAMMAQVPQARVLRRGSLEEARSAYAARKESLTGSRTRQSV